MTERDIDDRILIGGQHLAQLRFPLLPLKRAPEVIGPQEATLQDVLAQPGRLRVVEHGASRRRHDEKGALEQLVARRADEEMIWLPGMVEADLRPRPLRQPD